MLDGTVSIPLLLLLGEAARTAGVPEYLVRAETGPAATADEAARAPLPSLIRLWEHLAHALRPAGPEPTSPTPRPWAPSPPGTT
ncbi:hypothetical protein [Nocardiopsis changdeensis]|uniref:hypothetical protein n=1 Tax=Nocardiopsis changdeensis TaxID=2831969 RepID=UPI003F469A79